MARQYQMSWSRRLVNRVVSFFAGHGIGRGQWLLTTRGRKSGEFRTTPVTPITVDGARYVVAPYGEVGWVHNAREAGRVTLRLGNVSETHRVTELEADAAAPVLQAYVARVPVVRPYFDVTTASSVEDYEIEAPRHPVFRLDPIA